MLPVIWIFYHTKKSPYGDFGHIRRILSRLLADDHLPRITVTNNLMRLSLDPSATIYISKKKLMDQEHGLARG